MDILIHADGLTLSTDLKDAIEEKIGRIEQYAPRSLRTWVRLRKTSAHPSARQFLVRVVCELPGRDTSAEERGADPLSALDLVAEKIERRLRKRKTALLARRKRSAKVPKSKKKAKR